MSEILTKKFYPWATNQEDDWVAQDTFTIVGVRLRPYISPRTKKQEGYIKVYYYKEKKWD
jgi:hypothetical protein